MLCSLATKLDKTQLDEIGALEKELGTPVLAFACHAMEPATMESGQLAKIKALEEQMGVSLVAVGQ